MTLGILLGSKTKNNTYLIILQHFILFHTSMNSEKRVDCFSAYVLRINLTSDWLKSEAIFVLRHCTLRGDFVMEDERDRGFEAAETSARSFASSLSANSKAHIRTFQKIISKVRTSSLVFSHVSIVRMMFSDFIATNSITISC